MFKFSTVCFNSIISHVKMNSLCEPCLQVHCTHNANLINDLIFTYKQCYEFIGKTTTKISSKF